MNDSNNKNQYDSPFAIRLRHLIGDTTIQAVADVLGVSRQAVSKYYNGITQPNAETIVKIAKHFDVSTDYLLGLVSESTTDMEVSDICAYTGLTQEAVVRLYDLNDAIKNFFNETTYTNNLKLELVSNFISAFIANDVSFSILNELEKYIYSIEHCKVLELEYPNIDFSLNMLDFAGLRRKLDDSDRDSIEKLEAEKKIVREHNRETQEVQPWNLYKIQKSFIELVEMYGKERKNKISSIEQFTEDVLLDKKIKEEMRNNNGEHTRTQE